MLEDKTLFDSDKLIDEVLNEEPDFILSDNFANVLAEKVGRRFAWEQYIKEFLIYLAAIVGIVAVSAGMALFWFEADWNKWFDFFLKNSAMVAGINIIVVFILFADRVLLRYFMYRSSFEE